MQCARGKRNHSVVKSSNEVSILMEMAAFLSAEVRRKNLKMYPNLLWFPMIFLRLTTLGNVLQLIPIQAWIYFGENCIREDCQNFV